MADFDPRLPTNPNPKDGETSIIIYGYVPSLALALSAAVIFGVLCVAHLLHALFARRMADAVLKRRGLPGVARDEPLTTASEDGGEVKLSSVGPDVDLGSVVKGAGIFQYLLAFGCAMEVVGYAFRAQSHSNPFKLISFVLNYFMIVCAPVFFSAAIYVALATIIKMKPEYTRLTPLKPKFLILIFVVMDVATIATQVAGAALFGVAQSDLADGNEPSVTPQQANNILLAGLAVQNASFLIFLAIYHTFLYRLFKSRVGGVARSAGEEVGRDKLLHFAILSSSYLIFLRTLYRLAEAIEGIFSDISTNEDLFAGLETVPVLLAIAIWVVIPFGWRVLK
ncbi:hypothetical protein IE53DRAFT_369759 [Violaceomyces palustris]|uniref:Uncharacterized protein n=1 Tax=Violaceomyces palustris TaxID=1673888 RepID=A0ACD0NUB9_9BASI|nr:hypothetical protein IE53DRAFT_369759 [Violaceomyces palustris]